MLFEGWVTGIADDEGAEDGTDTGSGASHTDGGGTSTDELGGRVNVLARDCRLQGTALLAAGGGGGRLQQTNIFSFNFEMNSAKE